MASGSRERSCPTLALLILLSLCLLSISIRVTSVCDRTFVSRGGGWQNGTFEAPTLTDLSDQSTQCVYTFVAAPHQRVDLYFTKFDLRASPPECQHEYIDVYSEVVQAEASELINSPFGGRYCGPIAPRRRISLYRALAFTFYTDKNDTQAELFSGVYHFINDTEYQMGTPAPNSPCSYVVNSTVKKTGDIISPTYPGAYPKDMTCTYLFLGEPGQRVRLEFRDFDLFFGGPHCPFDVVKMYDGTSNESALIGTYCGQQRNLVLYSSESNLFISFETIPRTANTQNRGFKGIFEFSESFVKLDFIKDGGEHIRGSECDQKILSKKESSGHVFSPNYPYPFIPKIVCRYFIYGMQDSQHLERVKLNFSMFNIPKGDKPDCTDGYLKIYLKGQETTDSYDKFDYELCGDNALPSVVVSDGPRLVMVFSSGELQGNGFKAKYTFETEYRIPGTPSPDGTCQFTYHSTARKRGEFNSPRYPSNYPSDTNCTYMFIPTPDEQVSLVFDHFKVRADSANSTGGFYGRSICQEDWVEMYNVYKDNTEKLIGRYCSTTAPGPLDSNRGAVGLKVVLHTDKEAVFSGFKARYSFDSAKSIFGDCGSNVSSSEYGVIASPNFPTGNYDGPKHGYTSKTCNWYVNVRPNHKILLNFEYFAVEGEASQRGCPAAVVRLWYQVNTPPVELCGEKSPLDKWHYISETNHIRLSFITADKSVGAKGFKAVWTEVGDPMDNCSEFRCTHSLYCIASKLRCNRVNNCGPDDNSDELDCVVEVSKEWVWPSAVAGVIGGLLLLGFVFCVCWRSRSSHRRGARPPPHLRSPPPPPPTLPPPPPPRHDLGHRFASVDSV